MAEDPTPSVTEPAPLPSDEAAELLAALRRQLEESTAAIERLSAELAERTQALAEVEAVSEAVLGATDVPVIVVGGDRRVRAISRGAAAIARGAGSAVGRPLSAVFDDELAAAVAERLDAAVDGEAAARPATAGALADGRRAEIDLLDDGGAVVVLREP